MKHMKKLPIVIVVALAMFSGCSEGTGFPEGESATPITVPTTTTLTPALPSCVHNGRGHGYLGYNPGTHTHPHSGHGPHVSGKCEGR